MALADNLTTAAAKGDAAEVARLLRAGAPVNGLNCFGRTALQVGGDQMRLPSQIRAPIKEKQPKPRRCCFVESSRRHKPGAGLLDAGLFHRGRLRLRYFFIIYLASATHLEVTRSLAFVSRSNFDMFFLLLLLFCCGFFKPAFLSS